MAGLPVLVGLDSWVRPLAGLLFAHLRRRICFGSLEPVAMSVRPAVAAQMMVAAAIVTVSLGWVETGGRKCVAAVVTE